MRRARKHVSFSGFLITTSPANAEQLTAPARRPGSGERGHGLHDIRSTEQLCQHKVAFLYLYRIKSNPTAIDLGALATMFFEKGKQLP